MGRERKNDERMQSARRRYDEKRRADPVLWQRVLDQSKRHRNDPAFREKILRASRARMQRHRTNWTPEQRESYNTYMRDYRLKKKLMALDILPISKEKQHELAIEAALKEQGIANTVFWKKGVLGLVKRIGYNILDVDESLQKFPVEKAVEKIEGYLYGDKPPKVAMPSRSIDEVISPQVHDQGRLDQSTGTPATQESNSTEEIESDSETESEVQCPKCGTVKQYIRQRCPTCRPIEKKAKAKTATIETPQPRSHDIRRVMKPKVDPDLADDVIAALSDQSLPQLAQLLEEINVSIVEMGRRRERICRAIVEACGGIMPDLQAAKENITPPQRKIYTKRG